LKPFRLHIHLGCEDWERFNPQEVDIELKFGFQTARQSVTSDRIEDAICYAKVCEHVALMARSREFKLIEKLAHDIKESVEQNFSNHDFIKVTVHKLKPPVDLLTGGVTYSCGDLFL